MEANIGKSLREARLKKNLSIEEVAQATKIPKARIVDLENDDYSRFPSMAYARGFLSIYARYLNVDRSKYAPLDVGNHLSLADYQYLKEEAVTTLSFGPKRNEPPRRKVWLKRLGFLTLAVALGVVAALAVLEWNRLPSIDQLINRETPEENATAAAPAPTPEATPEPTPEPEPPLVTSEELVARSLEESLEMEQELTEMREEESAPAVQPEATPTPPPPSAPVNSSSEITGPAPEEAAPLPPEPPVREIKVTAKKRTRVKIVGDNGRTIFNDWLRRGGSISAKGRHFQIETRDANALNITSDGKPVSTAPGANNSSESGIEIR